MAAGFEGLKGYKLSYRLAMEIFNLSKHFPTEEKYSLTDQIRRSSRSVLQILLKPIVKDDILSILSVN